MGQSFRQELHRLELRLFQANQRLINQAVEGYTEEFRRYEQRYDKSVRRAEAPSTYGALLKETKTAELVLFGDYHTFPPAQRAFLRLLRHQPRNPPITIALEAFRGSDQPAIDRFLARRISEGAFLKQTAFAARWPFGPFSIYRPLFDLARERGFGLIGLDHPFDVRPTLADRDLYAAERMLDELEEHPGRRVFALIGEMHLAPSHLPLSIARAAQRRKRTRPNTLRIHFNSHTVYFELAPKGLTDHHDVFRLRRGAYSLHSASPVVCQQSFLTWLEAMEEGELESGTFEPEAAKRVVRQALRTMGHALGLDVSGAARRVDVTGPDDLSFLERERSEGRLTKTELKKLRAHILSSESCYIPKARLVYLAKNNLTHAAEEAAHYLRHHLSGEGMDDPKGLVDAFYVRILNEAVGFLGSKLVNPKRRAPHPKELEELQNLTPGASVRALDIEAARLALEHMALERGDAVPVLDRMYSAPPPVFNAVTHLLGYILGDRLYYGLVQNKLSVAEARALFIEPFEEDGGSILHYFELLGRTRAVRIPRRLPRSERSIISKPPAGA